MPSKLSNYFLNSLVTLLLAAVVVLLAIVAKEDIQQSNQHWESVHNYNDAVEAWRLDSTLTQPKWKCFK